MATIGSTTNTQDYVIDHDYLGNLVEQEVSAADTWMNAELAAQQSDNLDYYYGEPYGNEEPGFSDVVTRDVLETVEGIMPELMKMFTSSDTVVEFDPVTPMDEEHVKIQGEYINHLFMNRGQGYNVLYDWFKDSLLMKNGIVKVGWCDREEIQFKEYTGLTEEEFNILKDAESEEDDLLGTYYEIDDYEEEDGLYDVRLKIVRQRGAPDVQVIPSEEFRIKERSKCIQDSYFVAHCTDMTIGEVIEMGYDEDEVSTAAIRTSGNAMEESEVPWARWKNPDETNVTKEVKGGWYDNLIEVTEAYLQIFDPEDSKVKIFKCFVIGRTCLSYEEVNRIPFISLTPIKMPHKFTGIAVADLVRDIQEIRSTVYRQMLDNLALQNAGRYTAIEGQVNLQDLIDNKIGGIVRQKMPGAVGRLDTPDLSQYTIPMLEQLDLQKENRTGVSRMTHGLDENALNSHQTATAVNAVMTAAQAKILLIARTFAETGVKELFFELYNLIREHQTMPDMVPIQGRFAVVNPTEWIDRYDVHVNVGIGRGNKDQQLMHLQGISQLMQQIGQTQYGYLIQAENVHALATEFIKNSGYPNAEKFIANPASVEPPPPPPNPDLIKAETDAKFKEAQAMKMQADTELAGGDLNLKKESLNWEKKVNAAEMTLEAHQDRPVGVGNGK